MPRVAMLWKDYRQKDLVEWIVGRLHSMGLHQKDMAPWLNITPAAVGVKIRKCQFSFKEMLIIFDELGATDEEILKIMKKG